MINRYGASESPCRTPANIYIYIYIYIYINLLASASLQHIFLIRRKYNLQLKNASRMNEERQINTQYSLHDAKNGDMSLKLKQRRERGREKTPSAIKKKKKKYT